MQWDLAGYSSHPIDGDADRVSSLSTHLVTIVTDIRAQNDQLRSINSGEFWESSAGSADAFQGVVDDLPEKLDLVATRYENVASALDTFCPVLADAKQDAEYWIEQAADAQAEVERAQSGIQLMEDFADQAQLDAEAANEDREDGDPEVEPDEWQGEDYRATLAQAEADLNTAVSNVQSAVSEFESAGQTCAQAIHDAGDDDLENEGGLFAGIGRALDSLGEFLLDALDIYIQVLSVIGAIIGVVVVVLALTIGAPFWLVVAAVVVAAVVLVGTIILYANDRRDGWDVAWAAIGLATAGLGVGGSGFAAFFTGVGGGLGAFDLGLTAGGSSGGDFLEAGYDAFSEIDIDLPELPDLPDTGDPYGPFIVPGPPGLPPIVVPRPPIDFTGLSTFEGLGTAFGPAETASGIDIPQSVVVPPEVNVPAGELPAPEGAVDLPQVTTVVTADVPAGGGQ